MRTKTNSEKFIYDNKYAAISSFLLHGRPTNILF